MGRPPQQRKRRRRRRADGGSAGGGEDRDYLSGLPDDVLLSIFSRLSTRHAVTLSAISRRFRCLPSQFGRIESAAVSDPSLPLPSVPARPGFLPNNVLSPRSLAVVSLDTCALPRWCPAACPQLRTLRLHHVAIPQRMIKVVLKAAPLLENLEMVYCTGFAGSCRVESSSVRNLLFKSALEQRGVALHMAGMRTFTLYTRPKVQALRLEPSSEIRKAYLHIARPRIKERFRIRPFLDAGKGLTCLTLRGYAIKVE
uniref:F-box domain-containing protein n=1 Tax=Leersia perrieri TaxID=77586 RepID=A0A0D9V5P9_9ORYZ